LIKQLLKQPQFLLGFFIIISLLFVSLGLNSIYEGPKEVKFLYKNDGSISKVAPFSPTDIPPFGTDRDGRDLFYMILDGAKYTLLIALGVAFLRLVSAVLISFLYKGQLKNNTFFNDLVQSTLYVPATIFAYMLMIPLFIKSTTDPISFGKMVIIQCIILTLIGIPSLVVTFSGDIKNIMNKDYIISTMSLGAKKKYIYRKHVLPEIKPKLFLLFAQQAVQILILLAHLGVLAVFVGGSQTEMRGDFLNLTAENVPIAGEWSGIIGHSFQEVLTAPWIILIPLGFFFVSIFSINMMISGLQNIISKNKRK
jgi:peptide/nickel transport system permease protein